MLKLSVAFENEIGKVHRWSLAEPNPGMSGDELKAELQRICDLDVFEKDEVKLFQKLVSGKYVETVETELF